MCENSSVLSVVLFFKDLISLISIFVPIVLILMVSVDVFKMVVGDTNVYNDKIKSTIKKSIAAALVFFVPTFVNLLLSLLGKGGYETSYCWINANKEVIAEVKELEEARRVVEEEKKEEERKKSEEERKSLEELREQARIENEKEAEEAKKNNSSSSSSNSSSSTSGEVFAATKYDLTQTQLIHLARVCKAEQGSVDGAAAEASLMANLFEKASKSKYGTGADGLYNYVRTSGWFAHAASNMDNGSYTPEILAAVKEVLVNGNRTMPSNVVEHDCWFCNKKKYCDNGNSGDICKIIVNGKTLTSSSDIKNRNNYIKDETVIYNVYGSIYKFYTFPSEYSDPFGYIVGYY